MKCSTLKHTLMAKALGGTCRYYNRGRLTVLMFHGLTDREHAGLENAQHKHLHIKLFEAYLDHIQQCFTPISLDRAVAGLESGQTLPANAIVLTFDDGFRSNYTLGYPLLKQRHVPATIYLATEFVNQRRPVWVDRVDRAMNLAGKKLAELVQTKKELKALPQEEVHAAVSRLEETLAVTPLNLDAPDTPAIYHPLNWNEIREMQSSGLISFGAHTHTHKILGRCRPETVREEVSQSKTIIEEQLQQECIHFCYPNGGEGDSSQAAEQILKDCGYRSSVLALGQLNRVPCSAFSLDRLGVTNDLSLAQFELMLCGFSPFLHDYRQRRARGESRPAQQMRDQPRPLSTLRNQF